MALLLMAPVIAQTQVRPSFEVASIKPTQHGRNAQGWSRSSVNLPSPNRLVAENSSLDELIRFAYNLKDYQISGPAWLNDDSESFDIDAKAPLDTPKGQIPLMLQTLLEERFKLTAHRENEIMPVFDLVVDKNGPTLKPASPGGRRGTSSGGGTMTATSVTMTEFAYQLARELKRPVLDKTEIAGAFDVTLHYSPESDEDTSVAPSIFTAIQKTIGLRLRSAKGPVEILIIDHIDKSPTPN
jgi:uncharacterized protein (TIGR03435 family)